MIKMVVDHRSFSSESMLWLNHRGEMLGQASCSRVFFQEAYSSVCYESTGQGSMAQSPIAWTLIEPIGSDVVLVSTCHHSQIFWFTTGTQCRGVVMMGTVHEDLVPSPNEGRLLRRRNQIRIVKAWNASC